MRSSIITKESDETENEIMRTANMRFKTSPERRSASLVVLAGLVLMVLGFAQWSFAEKSGPKTFSSAGEACQALHQAVQNHYVKAVEAILGIGKEGTSSGNEAQDKLERERFSQKYREMHRLVKEPDGTTVLYIGAENWPFPIPLVSKNGRWYFDPETGTQEILFRRVGENETTAIQVCRALLTAEKQPEIKATSDDPIDQYAQKLLSAITATAGTTTRATSQQQLFSGYYFRILQGQSAKTAAASTASRASSGKRKGLVLIAYPAKYRSSGVMSFIVTEDGAVYEKDLGPNTARLAPDIKQRPRSGWALVN
jgi:Protein of unknown function (DUF2950)